MRLGKTWSRKPIQWGKSGAREEGWMERGKQKQIRVGDSEQVVRNFR
jgi:hypothetical protein